MNELGNKTLAQIVTDNHRTAAVLEKYHLDYCCKGKRTLEKACAEQEIYTPEVMREIQAVSIDENGNGSQIHFDQFSLTQLCNYIVETHHAFVKRELPHILGYLQKVLAKHGSRHPELAKIVPLFNSLKEEMEIHMQKEEFILFPRITLLEKFAQEPASLKLNLTYLQAPISVMEQEHDHAASLLEEIRILSNDFTPPPDACTTFTLAWYSLKAFERDLHHHVHLENNLLFPRAIELFKSLQALVLN